MAGSTKATRSYIKHRLVRDHTRQVLGLLNPALDLGLGWYLADEFFLLIDFQQFPVEVLWVPLRQLWHGVDARCL